MRWLRGVLIVCAVAATACGDDGQAPVPSASLEESKPFCDQLLAEDGSDNDLERAVPDALKDDYAKWRAGNDPEKKHVGRLNEYARKACGVPFDEPGFGPTTTAPTSTSATVAP